MSKLHALAFALMNCCMFCWTVGKRLDGPNVKRYACTNMKGRERYLCDSNQHLHRHGRILAAIPNTSSSDTTSVRGMLYLPFHCIMFVLFRCSFWTYLHRFNKTDQTAKKKKNPEINLPWCVLKLSSSWWQCVSVVISWERQRGDLGFTAKIFCCLCPLGLVISPLSSHVPLNSRACCCPEPSPSRTRCLASSIPTEELLSMYSRMWKWLCTASNNSLMGTQLLDLGRV